MRKSRFSSYIFLVAFCVVSAICQQPSPSGSSTFTIENSKPYVYLAIDHIGPRKPLRDGEVGSGIWFRLTNNCKIPIVVIASALDTQKTDQASWVSDEVIPNAVPVGAESVGSMIGYRHGEENFTDIFLTPNNHEAEIKAGEALARGTGNGQKSILPRGYIDLNAPSAPVLKLIPPGAEVLFSVPANHVGKSWHMEVPFRFAIEPHVALRQPYSYVAFFWEDLPEAYRSGHASPAASQ
jgi:hypothetical protein